MAAARRPWGLPSSRRVCSHAERKGQAVFYQVVLQLVVEAEEPADVADGLNELLRSTVPSFVVDWAFVGGDHFAEPLCDLRAETYEEGDAIIGSEMLRGGPNADL